MEWVAVTRPLILSAYLDTQWSRLESKICLKFGPPTTSVTLVSNTNKVIAEAFGNLVCLTGHDGGDVDADEDGLVGLDCYETIALCESGKATRGEQQRVRCS